MTNLWHNLELAMQCKATQRAYECVKYETQSNRMHAPGYQNKIPKYVNR